MFEFAQDSLGLFIPLSDLMWRNVFPLMMQGVTVAQVIGKEDIGGVTCDHLLFSRPGGDFQIWIPDSGRPLPLKYVVTDTGTPSLLSIVTIISNWNVSPAVTDAMFTFVPPKGVKAVAFMRPGSDPGPNR